MILFVIFILSAVIIGVGAMLSPALPTEHPRIGVASALALVFVLVGGISWTQFFGWDTLVIDYLLFGMVSLVVLGGTMMQATQADDDDPEPNPIPWLSRTDLVFLLFVGLLCIVVQWTPIFPLVTESVVMSSGEMVQELSSFGIKAHTVLSAYLAEQLRQDNLVVQEAIISVIVFLCVFVAYDLGTEIKNATIGKVLAIGVLIGSWGGLYLVPVLSIFLASMLLVLTQLFFMVRFARTRRLYNVVMFLVLIGIGFLL